MKDLRQTNETAARQGEVRVIPGQVRFQGICVKAVRINASLLKHIRSLSARERREIGERMAAIQQSIGQPHRHRGLAVTMQWKEPLTPALSPSDGAREKLSPVGDKSLNSDQSRRFGIVSFSPSLLLPFGRGEGRDEGFPVLHRYGLGLRKLQDDYFEIRVGLKLRLVFENTPGVLVFEMLGDHDDVKNFLKSR